MTCKCKEWCGDVPEEEDPDGVCKSLPYRREQLLEVVLVDRNAEEYRHRE